jgi:hypothetical protein
MILEELVGRPDGGGHGRALEIDLPDVATRRARVRARRASDVVMPDYDVAFSRA